MSLKRLLYLFALLWSSAVQASRDFSFFLFSVIHVGSESLKASPPVIRSPPGG